MKNLLQLSFACIFTFCVTQPFAQIALNGTVQIIPYQGLQPEIIDGVSALPATSKPVLRHVCLVNKNILALTIDEQAVIYNKLQPYNKEKGDTVLLKGYHGYSKVLERKGEQIAFLCGVNENWYRPFNKLTGEKLDVDWISDIENFSISSEEDNPYKNSTNPIRIFRKTYPNRRTHVSQKNELAMQHEVFLVLPEKLINGKRYIIKFGDGSPFKKQVSFIFDETRLRSEAIHLNLVGYQSNEPKIGFLSSWLGDGGNSNYDEGLKFRVIDTKSGSIVFEGLTKLKNEADKPEFSAGKNDYSFNLKDVYQLDFTNLKTPGKYRLVVSGIGCSFDFEIRDDIWEKFTRLNMKGFLHQRSGIELGPPYTDYQRPRNMHPRDETTIHKCDVEKFFNINAEGQQGIFKRIQSSILMETKVPEAWGGWMDAGDFDQRMPHLYSVHRMMYLYEMNSEYFENLNLGIPESKNNIPDILDEAMWCLDLYKRTQSIYSEGGISWWVESVEHPRGGECSWLNSLPTALIPPTPGACYTYASCAAQMSIVVRKYNSELANDYLESALAAMKWIELNPGAPDIFGNNNTEVTEAMAFVNLFRSTGEKLWFQKLTESLKKVYPNGINQGVSTNNAEILLNYLLIKDFLADERLTSECISALLKLADELTEGASQNTYNIFKSQNKPLTRMVLPARSILPVAAAHFVTKDKKYSDALSKTIQYTMGANPMNRSYVSGLGERWFIPYQLDFDVADTPAPSGIPNFGPATQTETTWGWTGDWAIKMVEAHGLYPSKLLNWPFADKCFNNTWIAPINEFTMHHPMGELIMLTGYLAQNSNSK